MRPKVIKAPAGIGKTVSFAQHVATRAIGITEVYVRTHANAIEWRDLIKKANPAKVVSIIAGRSVIGDDGSPRCVKHEVAEGLARAGFSVYPHLCSRAQGKSKPPLQCEHYQRCRYIQQFGRADVYIFMHAHLVQPRTVLEGWSPELIIIDESFINTCVQQVELSLSMLRHPNLPESAKAICRDIAAAFAENRPIDERIEAARETGELRRAMNALRKSSAAITPAMTQLEQQAALKQAVGFTRIHMFLQHVRRY